jgi:bifunctional non-homologous end joining protein LigD
MPLNDYRKKRDFSISPEPSGAKAPTKNPQSSLIYVVQKHRATQLHYDFRLEFHGTLLSWAVPKGPSLDPSVKRLAMQVEDHPVDYADFEGVIPEGEYGGGTVMVWDKGTWSPESPDVSASLEKGDFKFTLHGKKLKGSWVLVRTRGFGSSSKVSWLLIKHRDAFASTGDVAQEMPRSAISNRLLADIARDNGGDVEKAATGDPAPLKPAKSAKPAAKSRGNASKAPKKVRKPAAPKPTRAPSQKQRKTST